MNSNLPPGVTEGMLPGNRPEDMAWDKLHESIDNDAAKENMTDMDVFVAWKLGLAAWKETKELGGHFPHDGSDR
jgi:hypothetical protein